jgi:hypothetical protein
MIQFEINPQTFNCIWNEKELPEQRKEFIVVRNHKKGHATTRYEMLPNILLSSLNPYAVTDHVFCIRENLEKSGSTMGQYIGYL